MKRKKSIIRISILTILLVLSSNVAGVAYGEDFIKTVDVAPFIENNRSYDTVRWISEAFGIFVDWDQASRQVTLSRGEHQICMQVGSYQMTHTTPEGETIIPLEVAPLLRENRVFLPVRLWAEEFGLRVEWREEDGSVAVSEGSKVLTFIPGKRDIVLTGGHFLQPYKGDDSFIFCYPESGVLGLTWEGYAEVSMICDGEEYIISAINAGAGRSDPILYTDEEINSLLNRNIAEKNLTAEKLTDLLYGVPAYRVSGIVEGIPQAGVVFLNKGFLCGLTIEAKWKTLPNEETENQAEQIEASPDSEDREIDESELNREAVEEHVMMEESLQQEYMLQLNLLLDEIMASFKVK
ncbi:MAG: copper amine oxidase N-terminal domain-containing protein [Clostridiales bacterium]|nr:copper amine oxidase N-terminal domain-containing protein [Clostridiales bacterium]MCL2166865.1 copper amine oxidase N-terminal domain-containing protein [Clostridiales bacterium]MCL2167387.1 copper amine oxidase N-terminal domain-containing protein [Clostridiales bacterium]